MPDRLTSALARLEDHGDRGWTVSLSLVPGAPAGARWECAAMGPEGRRVRTSAAELAEAVERACGVMEGPEPPAV